MAPTTTTALPAPNAGRALPGDPRRGEALPRADSEALPSFGNAPFASEGPLLLERASSDGRWALLCQARKDSDGDGRVTVSAGPRGELRGDQLERYLVAPGQELAVDGLLSADVNGRYALVMQRGALLLWAARSGKTLDLSALGADARLSAESFAAVRTLAFDESGEHLLYVRTGEGARLVLRSLSDGSERVFDPGPGAIWRARLDPGGVYAVLEMLTADSNKNGRADFPAPLLAAPRACSASPGRFHTWVDRGDRPETVLVPLAGGATIHEPDFVMPLGDALVLRDETGALQLERAGKKRLLEPAACKGRIVHADAQRELFIVGCAQKKKTGHVSLELVTRTERKALGIELASVELDREVSDAPRLLALYPGLETSLFDADRRELLPLQTGDVVIATRANRALIRRGKALLFYDADSHQEQPLSVTLDKYPEVLSTAPFAFISPALVNLDTAQLVGLSQQRPLALSSEGQLLVPEVEPDTSGLTRGPLHWFTPTP